MRELLPWIVSVVDILIVTVVLYWVIRLLKGTRAERMLYGLAVVVVVYFISGRAELNTLHWILSNFLGSIVIIIIVVFQQDIRRALVQVGRPFTGRERADETGFLDEISRGVISMSNTLTGGLIVIERSVDLSEFFESGVEIDAEVTRELIMTIFNKHSPLHDGAVIVKDGRIAKAGCILPLTEKELTKSMGTRHRAAIGMSEETDAVVIVISEKTGGISIVFEEKIELGVEPGELLSRLRKIFTQGLNATTEKGMLSWRFWV